MRQRQVGCALARQDSTCFLGEGKEREGSWKREGVQDATAASCQPLAVRQLLPPSAPATAPLCITPRPARLLALPPAPRTPVGKGGREEERLSWQGREWQSIQASGRRQLVQAAGLFVAALPVTSLTGTRAICMEARQDQRVSTSSSTRPLAWQHATAPPSGRALETAARRGPCSHATALQPAQRFRCGDHSPQ